VSIDPHHPWHVLHEGYTVLVTERDGSIEGTGREGLFDFDTRILCRHRIDIDGEALRYLSGSALDSSRWEGHLALKREGGTPKGPLLPQDTLEMLITRRVGQGMAELISLTNQSMAAWAGRVNIELDADFRDVMVIGNGASPIGSIRRSWDRDDASLVMDFRASHGENRVHRALRVRVVGAMPEVKLSPLPSMSFPLALGPGERWTVHLVYGSLVDEAWREPLVPVPGLGTERDRARMRWESVRTTLDSSDARLTTIFQEAVRDLFGLRAWEYDAAPDAWFPNAGVPTYTGIMGRDVLTAGWQSALLGPEMMRGALACLARFQAREDSAWRDESPGKLPHEIRRGPLADLDVIPHRAYYGEQTAPSLFVVVLSEYWHWTNDLETVRHYRPVLDRLFQWAERYGDSDGDGLLEYNRRSPKGLKNQGWKDSDEAIRYPDGTIVADPIATLEEQAFHFLALQRMAELLLALDEEAGADRYLARARKLAERVNQTFWLDDEAFYAMGLDPAKQPIATISSNPGHALATGLVPEGRARSVADRLLGDELFSGWGVRTLSRNHPSFNPLAYHLGTVWPVENATFALGLKRYGLDDHVERLITAQLEAAAQFESTRLPEALGGHDRVSQALLSVYPGANSPQAWSSGAIILMVQTMLGVLAFAPAELVALVRPRLPKWVDWIELKHLRVGAASLSLRFERGADGHTSVKVLEKTGKLRVLTVPPPRDLTPSSETWLDHLKTWGLEHLPGKMARLLRIAVGIEE